MMMNIRPYGMLRALNVRKPIELLLNIFHKLRPFLTRTKEIKFVAGELDIFIFIEVKFGKGNITKEV
jgi:hypothetical protein